MNEFIFLLHTIVISSFALISLKLGRSALVSFISIQCILANLFVVKQTTLFGLTATCADAFTIGSVLGLNLLQEYHGKIQARKAIWISFFFLVFYALVAHIHIQYLPSASDTMHSHFFPILTFMPRIVVASFTAYLIVQHLDSLLYGYLQQYFQGRYLVLRNYTSIAICQLLDTILFSLLGLYGIVDNIMQVMLISYIIKLVTIVLATPFVAFSKQLSLNDLKETTQ